VLIKKKSIVFEEPVRRQKRRDNANGNRNSVKVATDHSSVSKGLREKAEGSIKLSTESSVDAIVSTSTLELEIDTVI
jgi:ATP-dependent Lhr-like helicase